MTTRTGARSLVRAEWIKLYSVRSTWLTIGLAVAVGLGVGLLDLATTAHSWATLDLADRSAFDPVADSFSGFEFAELAFGALGVLTISSEYATGTIQATLTATPRRGAVFMAKALTLATFVLVICQACAFAAFLTGQAVLSGSGLGVGIEDPHVLRAVTSAGVYMVVVTMVGYGLGAIVRHTAGAITAMVGLVFLAWPVARAAEGLTYLPDRWLLVNAGDALVSTHRILGPNAARTPTTGMAWVELAVYLAVLLGVGAWRMTRDP